MHQIFHNRCPSYLNDLVESYMAYSQRCQLRSSLTRAAVVKRTRTHFGKRVFSVCGPHTWNSLPPVVRNIDSYPAFRWALKSHLFHRALPINFYFLYLCTLPTDYCNAQLALFVWLGTITLFIIVGCILYWLFGPKNQSFRNKSGKTQPIRIKFGIRRHIKWWQRSGNFGRDGPFLAKWGLGRVPRSPSFLCGNPDHLSAT